MEMVMANIKLPLGRCEGVFGCLMFNYHVVALWRQAGASVLLGVAFKATSSKQTAETHRSKPQKGRRRRKGRGG